MTLILLRVIVTAFANMLSFIMIGKINERAPENYRISYFCNTYTCMKNGGPHFKKESKDQVSDVRSARDAKERENRWLWIVSLLGLPFIVLAHSLITIKILQAYLLTAIVFGGLIFLPKRPEIRKWWFWKAIATGLLVHAAILTGIFYWDNLNPQAAAKTFLLFGVLWAACMVDLLIVLVIVELFRPDEELENTQVK